ncbi:Retrovirus-related Pol polyprotein from transposon 17.6 [Trichinella britovi]|uniref:RNA-directed DNA polymerase n=4 Tax=Trichinella TaxID=6333 RepID=A0A0V1CBP0_TRIBR|nr:Retrovirus-related Pol polyprotein from transposon 17.6 [Trichinella britovi]
MPSTRSATSERPEENRQQLEEKAGTLQMGACPGNGHSILPVAVPPTCWRPPVLFSSGTEPNRWITSLEIFLKASGLPRCQWAVAALNHMDSAIQERLTARLGDDVNDYEVLKADLKKMFIPLKSEMSLRAEFCRLRQRPGEPVDAFAIRVQEAGERIRMTELQIVDRFREGTNSRAVLMALLEKEPTTMDEARRTALKAVEIEEASRSMDFDNNSPYDRRMEELTGALNRLITRLDDRLPPRGDNGPPILTPAPTGVRYVERTTKPALTSDMYQRKHPATIEARLEKLEEYYMRNRGNRTSREHPQPSRRLEGSSRKADHPLASATDVVIGDTPVINEDLSFPGILGMNFINECVEDIHAQEKYLKMRDGCKVKIARRRGPPGAMRCGETVGITDSVETAREEVEGHVRRMLERGLIEPAEGPWSSPVVLAKKKDGSSRFCDDYRRLNEVTRKDAQPLPQLDATLDALAGAKWFTTSDLASGYWQVEVDKRDREKTAFATPLGLYQFKVMPFGLCNAPGTFQQLMERTLSGLVGKSCLVYLDDIIVFSTTEEEHLTRLEEVFQRLKGVGLKIKPQKCQLMKKKVVYLGHVITPEGIGTDSQKTAAVRQWRTPRCVREVRQLLGLASYYRRFIKDFARVAGPLHELTRKGEKWQWGPRQEGAFTTLKNLLVSTLILGHPDFSRPFVLDVDASDTAIGPVLSQTMENGNQVVIAYISRALTRPEQRYCVTRKEMLALVWAVKQFRPYLYEQKFTARTDHNSLRWLRKFRELEGQVARWLEQLAEYQFDVVHRPGKQHGNADALSRQSCKQCGMGSPCVDVLGPLEETKRGNRYLLVICDYFTKWPEAFPMPDAEATTIARHLVNGIFCRFGAPETIHSDQGRNFESALIKELCELFGTSKTRTTAYHPQSDGLVERMNRTLVDMLAATSIEEPGEWDEYIDRVLLAYRTSVHHTTAATPSRILYGQEVRLPVYLIYGQPDGKPQQTASQYIRQLRQDLERLYSDVRQRAGMEQKRQKDWYDKHARGTLFEPGNRVWLQIPRNSKLGPNWEGPYRVLKRLDGCTYRVQQCRGKKKVVVHFDRMKPYAERVPRSTRVQPERKRQPPARLRDAVLTRT